VDDEDTRPASLFDNFGINCLEGRRGIYIRFISSNDQELAVPLLPQKEGSSPGPILQQGETIPIIPAWGTASSGRREEKEPVAKFQISRNVYSTEIVFDPPMYNPSIPY
jgi:hypothetical protein